MAYERKQWAMENLTNVLTQHAEVLGIVWGWGIDHKEQVHRHVLYIDTPEGQVSFHTEHRGNGPDYAGGWDGQAKVAPGRIVRWCSNLLSDTAEKTLDKATV
jgi:hypothetical protein